MALRRLPLAAALAAVIMNVDGATFGWPPWPRPPPTSTEGAFPPTSTDRALGVDVLTQAPVSDPQQEQDAGATINFVVRAALACVVALTVTLLPIEGSEAARLGRMGGPTARGKQLPARPVTSARGGPFRPLARGVGFGQGMLVQPENLRAAFPEATSTQSRLQDERMFGQQKK